MVAAGLLLVLARARAETAACPGCGTVAGRVHSRCVRRSADAAIGGHRVVIRLTVRRLFCPQAVQGVDLFHLWQNLAKAVERCVAAHRACLDEPHRAPAAAPDPPPPEPAPAARPEPTGKYADRARRHHPLVHGLLAAQG